MSKGKVEEWQYSVGLLAMLVGTALTMSILPFVVFVLVFTYLEFTSDRQ